MLAAKSVFEFRDRFLDTLKGGIVRLTTKQTICFSVINYVELFTYFFSTVPVATFVVSFRSGFGLFSYA